MKDVSLPRIVVIVLCAVVFIAVLIVNALAGAGRGPFHSTTGNVSGRYETDITPAGWTFSIWGVIYTWLTLMVIYLTSYVFRGSWAQCLLPYTFYFCWLANMVMNMIWLLLWDRELMLAALVVLILIAISNYAALFFCCFATDYYGLWLQTYHRRDLACLRILVQNGLAVYATWTSIASLINFSLVLHLWGVDRSTAATASLCILFAEVVAWRPSRTAWASSSVVQVLAPSGDRWSSEAKLWICLQLKEFLFNLHGFTSTGLDGADDTHVFKEFLLESWVLDRWVRYILTVYPVVIVALVGNILRHFNPADPTPNSVFMIVLLVLACVLLVSRICTVIWRNYRRPLHSPGSARLMVSPLDGRKFMIFT